jgi:hypothetical protein
MALRNIYNREANQYIVPTLDANVLEIGDVPINTSGGGASTITAGDGSITVTSVTGGYTLSNAGQNWSTKVATSNVNLNNHSLQNCIAINFPVCQLSSASGNSLMISNSNGNGTIFDTVTTFPYISTILAKNPNALGGSLTNANNISCNTLSTPSIVGTDGNLVIASNAITCNGNLTASTLTSTSSITGTSVLATNIGVTGSINTGSIVSGIGGISIDPANGVLTVVGTVNSTQGFTINGTPLDAPVGKTINVFRNVNVTDGTPLTIPIYTAGTSALLRSITVPSGYNFVKVNYNIYVNGFDNQSPAITFPIAKQFVVFLSDNGVYGSSVASVNDDSYQILNITSTSEYFIVAGTCTCYLPSTTSTIGLYIGDTYFDGETYFSSASLAMNQNSAINCTCEFEEIPAGNYDIITPS